MAIVIPIQIVKSLSKAAKKGIENGNKLGAKIDAACGDYLDKQEAKESK